MTYTYTCFKLYTLTLLNLFHYTHTHSYIILLYTIGSTFLELKDTKSAITAVMKDKQKFMGRPLKIYYCPPRPTDQWPPRTGNDSSGTYPSATGGKSAVSQQPPKPPIAQLSEKPDACRKLYCGNLSYNIDDEAIVDFFKDCGKLVGLRWLTHKDTGDFRVSIPIYLYIVTDILEHVCHIHLLYVATVYLLQCITYSCIYVYTGMRVHRVRDLCAGRCGHKAQRQGAARQVSITC